MKVLIVSFAIISLLSSVTFGQTADTLWFSQETNNYSRCLLQVGNEIYFGTSKTGVVAYDLKNGKTRELLANKHQEEVRDLVWEHGKLYALFSGDHGFVYEIDPKTTKNTLILADSNTFLDDLASNGKQLFILGDPKDGNFYLQTFDFKSRKTSAFSLQIPAETEEACYAASGTTALFTSKNNYVFISGGGKHARIHYVNINPTKYSATFDTLPLALGSGAGPFSFAYSGKQLFVVGGNYQNFKDSEGTACFQISNKWKSTDSPQGYRSCVIPIGNQFYTCGTNGIAIFNPKQNQWINYSTGNFCALYRTKKILYATSNKGFILKYNL